MIQNYFKTAYRNLKKHWVYSLINISGLAIGLTACFLIFLYVRFELSYDQFHTKKDRIYRLVTDIKTPSEVINTSASAWAFGPNIKADFPEVESFVRFDNTSMLIRNGENKYQEDRTYYADSSLFSIFDIKLLEGDPSTALRDPFSVVMSETTARKFFNTSNPIGQTVLLRSDNLPAKITGIVQDPPENSQFKADLFISMSTRTQGINKGLDERWGNFGAITFLLHQEQTKQLWNLNFLLSLRPAMVRKENKARCFLLLFWSL